MKALWRYALLLIALACGAALYAQQGGMESAPPPARTPPQAQYTGSVNGHVYCADTNAPARLARVMLIPIRPAGSGGPGGAGQSQATTALDGSFQIQNVAPGMYYVTAAVPGYLNAFSQVAAGDLTSTDPAAQERVAKVLTPIHIDGNEAARTEIRLERGASVSGTVTYDDGSPAIGVDMFVQMPFSSGAAATPHASGTYGQLIPRTDEYGRYRISGLPAGDYLIMASSYFVQGGGSGRVLPSSMDIYAPKSFRRTEAKVYSLKTGSEVSGVDILIPVAGLHAVNGTAESSDGHTLNAGSLTLTDTADRTHSFRSSVGNDGQFHFLYVPAGSYTLALSGAAITEPSTTAASSGNNRGRPRPTVLQSYGNATQGVLVENGDLSVVVQAPPSTTASTPPTP